MQVHRRPGRRDDERDERPRPVGEDQPAVPVVGRRIVVPVVEQLARAAEVEARGRQFWELNNPEDVPRLEAMMRDMGME